MVAAVLPEAAVRRKDCCHYQQQMYSWLVAEAPVLGVAAAITARRQTVKLTQSETTDHRTLVLLAETVVLLVEPLAVLAVLVIPLALDQVSRQVKVRQEQHRAAEAAVDMRLDYRQITTAAPVEMVQRVGSCSRIRQQQAADDDGEYS